MRILKKAVPSLCRTRTFYGVALLLSALAASPRHADASYLSGTFAGTISSATDYDTGAEDTSFEGTPVTGSFNISSINGATLDSSYETARYYDLPLGQISFSFSTKIGNLNYPVLPATVTDTVSLITGYQLDQLVGFNSAVSFNGEDPNPIGAEISFFSPYGSLFENNDDITTLHIDPAFFMANLSDVSMSFTTGSLGAYLNLNSITFDLTPPSAVPLPNSFILYLTSFIGLFAIAHLMLRTNRNTVFQVKTLT